MMSTAHLQQFPHGGMNGSGDMRAVGGRSQPSDPLPNPVLGNQQTETKRKRYWPPKQKKSVVDATMPLEEAAKEELANVPAKTPVSILQEILSRRGTTPNYELVQIEGAIHEPTFRYRVTVAEYAALGLGRSKKEAKHAAAKNVLDKIVGNPVNDEGPAIEADATPLPATTFVDKIPGNPIGTLQELCMARRWPPPLYSLNAEEGLPHERQFTITCTVHKHKQVGNGKSKKLAKRQAAQKMWELLQDQTTTPAEEEAAESPEAAIAQFASLKSSKISTLTAPHTHRVAAFHRSLKTQIGVKLEQLQTEVMSAPGFNYVQFLQEIGTEQAFEVTYVDVEETAKGGKYQCLVQLSTMPVAVCYGSGLTSKEAQSSAAHNALQYLKIMTRK